VVAAVDCINRIARWLDWSLEAVGRLRRTVWLLLRPVTELDNAPAAVDADTSSAVQRDAVVETQLVSLVLVFHVTVRRVRRAASHLCTRSHLPLTTASAYRRCVGVYTHTHTHDTHLTARCPGLPGWVGTRKVNQVCTSLQTDNHASQDPTTQVFYSPDALPVAQPTASKHWRLYRRLIF